MYIAMSIFCSITIIYFFGPVTLWMQAQATSPPISLAKILHMRLKRIPADLLLKTYITSSKAGLSLSFDQIESYYHKRGRYIIDVVKALIIAYKAGIPLTFEEATHYESSGADLLRGVRSSVNPETVYLPEYTVVTEDGKCFSIEVIVTLRAEIERILTGASQEAINGKIMESLFKLIGETSAEKFTANPDKISRAVLKENLDKDGAWTILSIDIYSIVAVD